MFREVSRWSGQIQDNNRTHASCIPAYLLACSPARTADCAADRRYLPVYHCIIPHHKEKRPNDKSVDGLVHFGDHDNATSPFFAYLPEPHHNLHATSKNQKLIPFTANIDDWWKGYETRLISCILGTGRFWISKIKG